MLTCPHASALSRQLITKRANGDFIRFPFNGFTYFFTFFPKCFSSFPHGTCSLSVSRRYLALDEIYHQFWAAIPNNPTLRLQIVQARKADGTGLSPSMMGLSYHTSVCRLTRNAISKLQFAEETSEI